MKTYTEIFSAGETKRLPGGIFFVLLETDAPVDIRFFGSHGTPKYKAEGMESVYCEDFGAAGFMFVEITSATAQTIKYGVSDRYVTIQRMGGTVDASVIAPSSVSSITDLSINNGASAIISPQNSGKKYALITVLNANSSYVRIGGSNVNASRGNPVYQGQTIPVEGQAAIHCRNDCGASAVVCVSDFIE